MAAVEKRKGGYPKGKPRSKPSTGTGMRAGVKLTRKLGTEICDRIAKGVPKSYAARASGVAPNTVLEWERRGRGEDERPATELTTWFAGEMERALAQFIESKIVEISQDEDWHAKAWMLERRFPDEFGRREIQRYEGVMDHTVRVELAFDATPEPVRDGYARRGGQPAPQISVSLDPMLIDVEATEES